MDQSQIHSPLDKTSPTLPTNVTVYFSVFRFSSPLLIYGCQKVDYFKFMSDQLSFHL